MLAVVGIAAAVVLRDIAAYERPPRERPVREPRAKKPPREPRAERRGERGGGAATVAAYVPVVEDGSMLGALALTEQDERSAVRRVVSALVLLTLTLLTAGLVGAGIYRGLSNFGK